MNTGSYHTYKEIILQAHSWEYAFKDIVENQVINPETFKTDYDQLILFGCGSSYNLSMCASIFSRYLSEKINSIALPSSELLINPDLYIRKSKKYLLIGFSRSGETTESVEVLKKMKDKKNVSLFTFTCNKNSSFSQIPDNNFLCRGAVEKSIVMTTSFSSMLMAFCTIFAYSTGNKGVLLELEEIIKYVKENMNIFTEFIKDYIEEVNFNSYFTLGSGFNYGLAVEADLKMKEMSQVPSYSYHLHEFSHGPKSLLNNESLCLVLTPGKKMLNYEKSLREFSELGTSMLIIGVDPVSHALNNFSNKKTRYFIEKVFKNEMVKSFINIPVFQLMAFFKTLKNNLNPDLPNNLSYTVKL
ncbi:MAG: SIS domain-containing protein [Candidatus Humimicrobiaceae bacterium]